MIIGFTGLKGSGKDTAGAYLVKNYGFTRLSFADKLKQSAAACFRFEPTMWDMMKNDPLARITVENSDNMKWTVTVREFLQLYGTEAHRDIFGFNFWVHAAFQDLDTTKNWVITDVRFNNEAEAIWREDGRVYKIDRGEVTTDTHASEAGVSESLLDGTIANTGTKEKLYILLDVLMERLEIEPLD